MRESKSESKRGRESKREQEREQGQKERKIIKLSNKKLGNSDEKIICIRDFHENTYLHIPCV